MEAINLPKPTEVTRSNKQMPLCGCRKVTPTLAYKYTNKYGVEKIHIDFEYKGYVFGQNFKLGSKVLYKLFNGTIDDSKIGKPIWVEIATITGSLTGNPYPEIVDAADEY